MRRALTLIETIITLVLIGALVAMLIPALASARATSHRDQCANNQRQLGQAWQEYLNDHDQQFPDVPVQPGWMYGGMRFSSVGESAYPDFDRPLTAYMGVRATSDYHGLACMCPADSGIADPKLGVGTGGRSAFRSFGTSYRANAALFDAPDGEARGMRKDEITTAPSRLLIMGDPVWYEVAQATGRRADWHGEAGAGNLLFLDGSVRFKQVLPATVVGPVVFDPMMPGSAPSPAGAEGINANEGAPIEGGGAAPAPEFTHGGPVAALKTADGDGVPTLPR